MDLTCKKHGKLAYIEAYPANFSATKTYPGILLLHGAGNRGNDVKELFTNPYFTAAEENPPQAVVFAPQCYKNTWFDIFEQLQAFAKDMQALPYIEADRFYLMGVSMGGYGTWQLAMTIPEVFAAIVPICGGGMRWNAARLKDIPVWAFHGSEDTTVLPEESRRMVDAVNQSGGHARLTVYEGVAHHSWNGAYREKELYPWLFAHRKQNVQSAKDEYTDAKKFG